DASQAEPRLLVLDHSGAMVLGPIALAPLEDYPGRTSAVAWTGNSYLVATPFAECPPNSKDCIPHTVSIRRLDPSLGKGNELVQAATFLALDPSAFPRRASFASFAGRTWLVWSEAPLTPDDAPRVIRLVELDANGNGLGETQVADFAKPLQ